MKAGDTVRVKAGRPGEGFTFIVTKVVPEPIPFVYAQSGDQIFGLGAEPCFEVDLEVVTPCPYPLPAAPRCVHCDGNKSMRAHARHGLTAHSLCAVRAKNGHPTPSLGDDVIPTQPNVGAVPVATERARALCFAQIADPVLAELAAQYIAAHGSCVWHAAAVVAAAPCACTECRPVAAYCVARS